MKATINIKADKEVKESAQRVAADLGMPLSVVINAYLKDFVRTREVHFRLPGDLRPEVKKRLDKAHEDVVAGRNLSPVFSSGKEMDAYLNTF
ncbi:MAG TPA: hypothetical protein VJJ22_00380 [Candidatus Paceibacterota bacterium]